ncbi:hypothetical protein [Actinoplanes sp. M2I2]|uniref:hypothetical protein n=1 Tax=Actinoplanes sp. M2I2 TaxID=1734444 RepID=UPI002020F50E|nr:hypothetical protein [Actinoplanes sp. M2I2]
MNLSAGPSFFRTIPAGYLGANLLTDGVADVADGDHWGWLWMFFGAVALAFLVQHLREQALRGLNRPGATWSRTDTANVGILTVVTALMLVDTMIETNTPPAGKAAIYTMVAVYAALTLDFAFQRSQVIRASTPAAKPTLTPPAV